MKRILLISLHAQDCGIAYDFPPRWGVALVGVRPEEGDQRIEAGLDPLIVSAGVRVRF